MRRQILRSNCFAAGLLLAGAVGCHAPMQAIGESQPVETAARRSTTEDDKPREVKAASAAADDATIAKVMKEARQISAENPAAGKLLLDELRRSEPKLWPLVLQQFRSEQAYHDMLVAKEKPSPAKVDERLRTATIEPPSAEVGQLADPRAVRSDAAVEQAFAAATPANMPAPYDRAAAEAAFAERPAPRPVTEVAAAPIAATEKITPASAVAPTGGVQQALYSTAASAPAPEPLPVDWQTHIARAIDALSSHTADGPHSTAEVHQIVSLRLMELLAGDTEAALEPIPNISTEEQDYWSGQIFALATLLDHHRQPDDKRRATASVAHLDEAVAHLREMGTLSLRNLAFCKIVYGYGAYDAISDPTFTAGQQVTLYLEVENYHSESTAKGFKTLLGASYEVVDDAGKRIASGEFPNVEDACQNRRRDFHIQYGLVLPKDAKAGKHQLKLVMNDRQSDKLGSASIAFNVR